MGARRGILGAAACAFAAVGAVGAVQAGADSPRDYVAGSARNTFEPGGGPNHLSVAAHGFEADVTGHVRGTGDLGLGEFRVEGEVTCIRVEGNKASVKYRFKHAQRPGAPPQGGGVEVFFEDNGDPANGQAVDKNS
ncbi:MAG TPA: hypothetical protein VF545_09170, partial [Thermoleophilaceae bacterium]